LLLELSSHFQHFLCGFEPESMGNGALTFIGGTLGVLFMVPLRRYLIVGQHGVLPYPEGVACAEVLVAGEEAVSALITLL